MSESMFCPVCRSVLAVTKLERYETLEEHVSDPNGTPALKPAYQCTRGQCVTRALDMCWGELGEAYYTTSFFDRSQVRFRGGEDSALNSWQRSYDRKVAWEKATTFRIEALGFRLEVQAYGFDVRLYRVSDRVEIPQEGSYREKLKAAVQWVWGVPAHRPAGYFMVGGLRSQIARHRMRKRDRERVAQGLPPLFRAAR